MKKELKAKIENKEIFYYNIDKYNEFIKKNEGKNIIITLDSDKNRTSSQNRYLWGCVYTTLAENRDSKEYWHNYWKCRLLIPKMIGRDANMEKLINNGKINYIGNLLSTVNLSIKEMSDYIEKIRNISLLEFGIYIIGIEEFECLNNI